MKSKELDNYINKYDGEVHNRLVLIRNVLAEVMPDADQLIRYNMPTFRLEGNDVIYFVAYKKHISLMPTSYTIERFADKLKNYKTTSSAIQFQNDEPLPLGLIKDIAIWNKKALKRGTLYKSST